MPTLQFSEGPEPPAPLPHRKQLLNHMVDGMAQVRPESVWAKIPQDNLSYDAGYRKITYRLFANAINGMAWWLRREIGESKHFDTLAYFGTWDPRYIILLLGAVKAGYKVGKWRRLLSYHSASADARQDGLPVLYIQTYRSRRLVRSPGLQECFNSLETTTHHLSASEGEPTYRE